MTTPLYAGVPGFDTSITPVAQDPSYLRFLRGAGLDNHIEAADAAAQEQMLRQAATRNLEDLEYAGVGQRRGILSGYEGRGMFRSSLHARDQAAQRRAQTSQASDLETNLVDQIARLNQAVARNQASRARGLAEQGMDLGYRRALEGV